MGLLTGCTRATLLKYTLLQLPGLALLVLVLLILDHWISLQPTWFWGILLLWLLKELILFPLTWRSYQSEQTEADALVGTTGRVVAELNPEGTIEVNGELWSALSTGDENLEIGARVKVLSRRGLVLTVVSVPEP